MLKYIIKYSLYAALSWTVIIFILCSTPGAYIPSSFWLELLSFDKLVHMGIFFTLMMLWQIHFFKTQSYVFYKALLIVLVCVLYGGLLEIMQAQFFSERSADWFDFAANTVGCVLGLFFYNNLFRTKKWRRAI